MTTTMGVYLRVGYADYDGVRDPAPPQERVRWSGYLFLKSEIKHYI